jgi:phosphoribosylamine--glycine ligase
MRILVIGSGGREHALVWKLKQSSRTRALFCAPGNGGIARDARCLAVQPNDPASILSLVREHRIDLVVVGPEAPLAAGLVDDLTAAGVPSLGPAAAAARLESSKVFSKEFMARHRIPTATFSVHESADSAFARLGSSEMRYPVVVKADGLAAGKGVVVARDTAEARDAVQRMQVGREFGAAGDRIVLEEFLHGAEASYIVFTDGETIVPAVAARDHKAAYDGDTGPNTGGMGAYSIDTILDPGLERSVLDTIVQPTISGMRDEGTPFRGMLYTGLMLTPDGPKVLEFNVRMGDPEGQAILPRMESDFAALCSSMCDGSLRSYTAKWKRDAAVCVVLASGGYPGSYPKGKVISGLVMAEEDPRVTVFHAGTKRDGDAILTDGGRVLGVTAVDADISAAIIAAYEAVNKIQFEGMQYRRDIGARAVRQGGIASFQK